MEVKLCDCCNVMPVTYKDFNWCSLCWSSIASKYAKSTWVDLSQIPPCRVSLQYCAPEIGLYWLMRKATNA